MKQIPLQVRLPATAVFDSFVPGLNGEIIAALRLPGTTPIWLWGPAGLGKTHLLQAVCAAAGAGAGYVPMRDLHLPAEALQGFERLQTVCIDDVDRIAGKNLWEQALFRLFNAASECGTRLIFAAAAAPRQIDWTLEDWRSRASACVVYQLKELDDAGRREALTRRAAQRGLQLPRETAEYLVTRMPRDLPTLCKILDDLDEASLIAQRRLTVPFIRAALEKHAET